MSKEGRRAAIITELEILHRSHVEEISLAWILLPSKVFPLSSLLLVASVLM